MSAMSLIVMAGIAMPVTEIQRVSAEILKLQRLDMSGEWEGKLHEVTGQVFNARISNGKLVRSLKDGGLGLTVTATWECVDEGEGKIRIKVGGGPDLGIYKIEGDRITISYRWEGLGRPSSFQPGKNQRILTLHRVKPRK